VTGYKVQTDPGSSLKTAASTGAFSKFSNEFHIMSRLPLPPFTAEKARMAKDAWNTRDPP